MDPRIVDPFEWANAGGALVFYGTLAVILVGAGLKLVGPRWLQGFDAIPTGTGLCYWRL